MEMGDVRVGVLAGEQVAARNQASGQTEVLAYLVRAFAADEDSDARHAVGGQSICPFLYFG